MKAFKAPKTSLGDLDAEAAAILITAAADIALIVDAAGVVRDVAFNSEEPGRGAGRARTRWLGRPWIDTVAPDSRPKVDVAAARRRTPRRGRAGGTSTSSSAPAAPPCPSCSPRCGSATAAALVAFGRDLRPLSALQQRLVEAQQSLDRDYSRLRHAETRYRLLFQLWSEPVLILDARDAAR